MSEQDIPVSENFQPAPGVVYEEETPVEPAEPAKAEIVPESTVEPAKPEAEAEPKQETKEPVKERPKKAGPIADLLEKKHSLEQELETERKARQELEAKISQFSEQPQNAQTDDDIKAFADANGIDESIVDGLVKLARKGLNPNLPKEVQEFIQENQSRKQAEAEREVFNKRVDSLAITLKDDQLKDPAVRQKLEKLAYSTELAPDGEPYYQKELAELYFGFIKPEVEPGKVSAESSFGAKTGGEIMDFEEVARRDDPKEIEAMDEETFKKFTKWESERSGRTPLRRL